MANKKEFSIIKTHNGKETKVSGTLSELTQYFGYTLEVGNSYNPKISRNPKSPKSLVSNLNRSVAEKQRGSFNPDYYELEADA